jgi:demethylmenaquinone methyltransferase/2-methoxy-6-polyprenyl-1,4-benzoquinol methylase
MFDGIAPRYDLMNRLMSAGQDARWRRIAVRSLGTLPPGPLLDIGTGTGDLALALRRQAPGRTVIGIDLSPAMMQVAAEKSRGRLRLARADVVRLPFPDRTFAGIATAFTLRNVADLPAALAEIRRVLRPDGRFACLEITRPGDGLLGSLFTRYFHSVVPRAGALVSGRPAAYRYLPASVDRFITGDELARAVRAAGFTRVHTRRFWPGAVTILSAGCGVRRAASDGKRTP